MPKKDGACVWALSRVLLFVTLWTVARQPPLSMEFSRQEYWSGLPLLPPGKRMLSIVYNKHAKGWLYEANTFY